MRAGRGGGGALCVPECVCTHFTVGEAELISG